MIKLHRKQQRTPDPGAYRPYAYELIVWSNAGLKAV